MSELKPCPFCGGEAEIMSHPVYTYLKPYDPETADKKYYAQCKACATQCGVLEYDTPEEAKAAWEHRAQPANEPLTLEELREMDNEPVWVSLEDGVYGEWCIVAIGTNTGLLKAVGLNDAYDECDYSKAWLAYRHKPEERKDER